MATAAELSWKHLMQERADLRAEADRLLARTGEDGAPVTLSDEERAGFDAKVARLEAINGDLDRLERMRALDRGRPALNWNQVERLTEEQAGEAGEADVAAADKLPRPFRSFGEQLQAVIGSTGPGRVIDPRLAEIHAAATGMGINVGADGGFLVQVDFIQEVQRRMYDIGQILSRVRRLPSPRGNTIEVPYIHETSRATGSRLGGVQGYWVAEGTAPTATKPKLMKEKFILSKVAALAYLSDELIEDAPLMEEIVTAGFAEELRFLVEDAMVNGTGVGQPLGVMNAAGIISVAKEAAQAADTVVFNNVSKMWSRCWARSRPNAVWHISQDVEPQLDTMSLAVGTGGSAVYLPSGGLSASPFSTLKGRPVIPVEYCAKLGDLGDILLVDWAQYAMMDKGGLRAATSMHVQFTTDEMALRVVYRVEGRPIAWPAALTPKNAGTSLSPFITLAERA